LVESKWEYIVFALSLPTGQPFSQGQNSIIPAGIAGQIGRTADLQGLPCEVSNYL